MRIVKESVSVDATEPDFVYINHVQIEDDGREMGGPLWLERANVRWVVESLNECLNTYAFPGVRVRRGGDSLNVHESGPEQAPIINLHNRRPGGATHAGVFALMMSKPTAEDLAKQLSALG